MVGRAGAVPSDRVAVLTRVNALLLAPQVALLEAGIPVRSALGLEVLERTGLRAALAYVRIAAASPTAGSRPRMWPRSSGGRAGGCRSGSATGCAGAAGGASTPWAPSPPRYRTRRRARSNGWSTTWQCWSGGARAPGATVLGRVLAFIKDGIGLGGAMSLLDSSRGGEGSSHLDDLDALEQVAGLHPDVATFEQWLRGTGWSPTVGRARAAATGVTLVTPSTVHRVKGMEWEKVAVFGVNAGVLPHRLATDDEEERRVLHVALTRCRRQVVMLSDESRPSPMLAELTAAGAAAPWPGRDAVRRRTGERSPAPSRARMRQLRRFPWFWWRAPAPPAGRTRRHPAGRAADRDRPRRPPARDPVVEQALRAWAVRAKPPGRRRRLTSCCPNATLTAIAAARPSSPLAAAAPGRRHRAGQARAVRGGDPGVLLRYRRLALRPASVTP